MPSPLRVLNGWLSSSGSLGSLVLPIVLSACVTAVKPVAVPVPATPAPVMLDEGHIVGLADLLQMEDRRELELERWTPLLQADHPAVRSRAALAAGRIGDQRATPLLVAATRDSVSGVRAAAVFALGRLADTTALVTQALATVLEGRDSAALEAPAALARQNTPAAYQALSRRLAQLSAQADSAGLRLDRETLLALWRFRDHPGAAELAAARAQSRDPAVRWAAAYVLMRVGTAATFDRLLSLAQDPDPLVRATAARGLRAGAADSAGSGAAARAALRRLLDDAQPHVRINAVRALAAFRDPADASALALLLQDQDGNVAFAAAEALGNLPAPAAAGPLLGLVADARLGSALRGAALASLVRTDTAAGLRLVEDRAVAPAWLDRLYAVRALAAARGPVAVELLRRLSRDSDPRVQGEAFGALAAADSSLPLTPLFLEGLAAPDPVVRANAAGGLASRHDPAFFSALLQAYDRAQKDTINDAALAAVDALAGLVDRGVPVMGSFFLRFHPPADPIVRARVAQRFGSGAGTWGPPRPVDTGRTDEFYRQVARAELAPAIAGAAPPPRVRIVTPRGDIVLALDPAAAPLTVHNFLELVRAGFYRRTEQRWHRVVPNFVLQDGDPRGDGSGGPPWAIRDELNLLRYETGTLGMALSGPDTGGSQFFITHSPQPHLDGGYTIFGRVVAGMDVAAAILQDDPILAIEVLP